MKALVIIAVFVSVAPALPAERVSYAGNKVLQTTPRTHKQLAFVKSLIHDLPTYIDAWRPPSAVNQSVILNVAATVVTNVMIVLVEEGLPVRINIGDLQRAIDRERAENTQTGKDDDFDYGIYHDFSEILEWVDTITAEHAALATVFDVGSGSYEGRPLRGVKISSPSTVQRPAVWIEGGIHAREWISPAVVMYLVSQLLDKYESYPGIKEVVDMFDWYFLPVTNPDGYTYTWTTDRLWRKTRTPNLGSSCVGTDPNRNWDYHWCEEGASSNPCSETYCGPKPFSEKEIKGVTDFILNNTNFKAFIDVHSFSQLWMSPWAYTTTHPVDFDVQDKGSELAVEALKDVHGTQFIHGENAETIYIASGSSADWAYGAAGIKFSYTVELRDTGTFGFLLPANQIIPSGQEMLQALITISRYIHNN